MNFCIFFFIISIVKVYFPSKISDRYLDMVYMICYTLCSFSVIGYWYLNQINEMFIPKIKINTVEYYCNYFINGGNLLFMTWYGVNLKQFRTPKLFVFGIFMAVFVLWYFTILIGIKALTGKNVYIFPEKMKKDELILFFAITLITTFVVVGSIDMMIKASIRLKTKKR